MNQESIDKLKKLVSEDKSIKMDKKDEHLRQYIMFRAKKELKNKAGMVDDEEVVGWAKHFYMEDKKTIDKEMNVAPKPQPKPQEIKPAPKPKPREESGQMTIFEFVD